MSTSNLFFQDHGMAEVSQAIAPRKAGQIFFQSTFWTARYADDTYDRTIPVGAPVQVVGRQGITQLVSLE